MSKCNQHHRVRVSAAPEECAVLEVDGHDVASPAEAYRIAQRTRGPK
ncbi:hypothetical protein [Streptomyces sp. NPDC003077]